MQHRPVGRRAVDNVGSTQRFPPSLHFVIRVAMKGRSLLRAASSFGMGARRVSGLPQIAIIHEFISYVTLVAAQVCNKTDIAAGAT